jgi:hypothetical protein
MIREFLFETWAGEWLVSQLERRAGLALVPVDWLDSQTVSPAQAMQTDAGQLDTRSTPNVRRDYTAGRSA